MAVISYMLIYDLVYMILARYDTPLPSIVLLLDHLVQSIHHEYIKNTSKGVDFEVLVEIVDI